MINGVKVLAEDIERTYGGKILPPQYNWEKDSEVYTRDGHIPDNRCYRCGNRFVGSSYASFCNICDKAMTTDHDHKRDVLIATRIRIPEDVIDEKQYQEKMNIPEVEIKTSFFRSDQLV